MTNVVTCGNTLSHRLFELVKVSKKAEANPPRQYGDYEISVGAAPEGVTIIEK